MACKPVLPISTRPRPPSARAFPNRSGPLADIAYNYRWSWTPGGPELLASIDPRRWELCLGNPVRLLEEVPPDTLARLAGDERLPPPGRRR